MRLQYFIATFLFLIAPLVNAQQDSLTVRTDDSPLTVKHISAEDLVKYSEDSDFSYVETPEEENAVGDFLQSIQSFFIDMLRSILEAIFGVGQATGILNFILQAFPYLVFATIVFLFSKFFLKVKSNNIISGQSNPPTVKFSEDEHIIKNEDIQVLIQKAISQNNYRLAIRYHYLQSLKNLSEQQIIDWKQQKTNEDYIKEISQDQLKNEFTTITRIYDYVWYGEFPIDDIKFGTLSTVFEKLNLSLKTN
ncbi:DUF4129 domain-containing protein [Mangrovimonas sp. TPBH4]|uniref:DUF4129 domain-containing protein n=1 Tax=Mangrovimonas sp. TPBH4 TaxID=1645914 RepID=UPI0006B5DFED|nr:DUF4129 domain-containing protein [Mangrovimonas sp. TPBH4]